MACFFTYSFGLKSLCFIDLRCITVLRYLDLRYLNGSRRQADMSGWAWASVIDLHRGSNGKQLFESAT